jgi:hypothetical protein
METASKPIYLGEELRGRQIGTVSHQAADWLHRPPLPLKRVRRHMQREHQLHLQTHDDTSNMTTT